MGNKIHCEKCIYWEEYNCPHTEFEVRDLDDCKKLFSELEKLRQKTDAAGKQRFIFRGQLSKYALNTTLERAYAQALITKDKEKQNAEQNMVREFQRWYNGENRQDVRESLLYCISLMRHHGAPTRLLDWTYSPYVALYNALQDSYDAYEKNEPFSVWALDNQGLSGKAECLVGEKYKRLNDDHYKKCKEKDCQFHSQSTKNIYKDILVLDKCRSCDLSFRSLFWDNKVTIACPENAYYFHSRVYAQQGLFLCMGDVTKTFEGNLKATFRKETIGKEGVVKLCCTCTQSEKQEALDMLRGMNIHRATLFPDLDGFGKHLWYRMNYFKTKIQSSLDTTGK